MTRHEELLEAYAKDLRVAKERAERWWTALRGETQRSEGVTRAAAERLLRERWPDGPASHPWVIAVIRKYWLACEDLNLELGGTDVDEESPEPEDEEYRLDVDEVEEEEGEEEDSEEEEVYPNVFIIEWLMGGEHDDLADFLGSISYWPVGLDAEDRYT